MGFKEWIKDFYCDSCDNPFPKSALIGIHNEKFCVRCSQSIDKETYYCDGCGADYPIYHLKYDEQFDGHFCSGCSI